MDKSPSTITFKQIHDYILHDIDSLHFRYDRYELACTWKRLIEKNDFYKDIITTHERNILLEQINNRINDIPCEYEEDKWIDLYDELNL
jgi:hypothetical protein